MTELEKRYSRAIRFLKRLDKAEAKQHWEQGESVEAVISEVRSFLSDLRLERHLIRLGHKALPIGSAENESSD